MVQDGCCSARRHISTPGRRRSSAQFRNTSVFPRKPRRLQLASPTRTVTRPSHVLRKYFFFGGGICFLSSSEQNWYSVTMGKEKKRDTCHKSYLNVDFMYIIFFIVASNWVNTGNLLRNFYYPEEHGHSFHISLLYLSPFCSFTLPIKYISCISLCLFLQIPKEFKMGEPTDT